MRIVFWQNCLSPHQLPYIVHLLDDKRVDEVVIVAGEAVSGDRKNMGWSVAKYKGLERCKVCIHPHEKVIESLLAYRTHDSHHLFSGIRADAFVFKCLRMSMRLSLKRGIITERPNTYDFRHNINNVKPYWLHRLRFWMQDRSYAKHIQSVFAMGSEAVSYFRSLGMGWKIFPFCYCTSSSEIRFEVAHPDKSPQYLFCGSLSVRKSPITMIRAFKEVSYPDWGG